jgi:hypothetical protein
MAVLAGEHRYAAHDLGRGAARQRLAAASCAPVAIAGKAKTLSTLEAVVQELRWSAARSSAARYALHGLLGAALWVLLVVVVARVVPVEQLWRPVALGVSVALVAAGIAWMLVRPRPALLMRTADLRLGLKERLSTAWERRTAAGPMDAVLRKDALEHAARIELSRAYPVRWRRTEVLAVAAAVLSTIALAVLPNPMDQVLSRRHADRTAQAAAAAKVQAAAKKLASTATPAPVDAQVQKILQETQAKIAAAPDPRTALQSITPAEQQLLQLSDPQTPARAASAQNLANNLASTSAGAAAGRALNSSPAQDAQAVRSLASNLQQLSPADRAELAKALASAAQQSKDPQMAQSLQAASNALASNDIAAAAQALNGVAGQLDSLQQQESNDQEIASAINALEAARGQLATQADRDAAQASAAGAAGTPAAGSGTGASGAGTGNGNGNGSGAGNGNGGGTGSGNGGNGGSGGTGGLGQSGSGSGSGTAAKSTERVYVPAPPAPGVQTNDPTPLGPGEDVPLTPYPDVIQAYQQAALDATQQSLIPGSEQDLIREYFSSLGEPSGGQ